MNLFRFANSHLLGYLYLLPILVILFIVAWQLRLRALKRFGNPLILRFLMPEVSVLRPIVKFVFLILALSSIILAMARPQFGAKLRESKRTGIELIIALDVSFSMLAEDISPNRIERAKRAINQLVDKLKEDRIGIIVFAGDAYVQIPLTSDYAAVKMMLSTINTNIVPKQGTAIASAINMATKSFNFQNDLQKAMIIITDGENHEDDPIEAAKKASEKGIIIHTIGIGSLEGTPIPAIGPYGQKSFHKDKQGNVVVTRLDEKILQEIARTANGTYIRATNANIGLQKIYEKINEMEKKEIETQIYSEYSDQFQYFIAIALILLVLEYCLLERKNRWLKNIHIFNTGENA